jgi:hypothetical protein
MSSKKLRPAVYEVDTNAEVSFYIPATAPEILEKINDAGVCSDWNGSPSSGAPAPRFGVARLRTRRVAPIVGWLVADDKGWRD